MTASKYQLLRRQLRLDVARLDAHAPLPTERELASRHSVSRATVRHALSGLERTGDVYRVQGAGTFVADKTVSKSLSLTSFTEDMTARGLRPGSRVIAADQLPATVTIADALRMRADDPVARVMRVRLADGAPMCLETAYLDGRRVSGLLEGELTGSLYELLDTRFDIRMVRAEQVVSGIAVRGAEAALLGVAPGTPALQVCRTGFDQRDQPVEHTASIYRADQYDIAFAVRREAQR